MSGLLEVRFLLRRFDLRVDLNQASIKLTCSEDWGRFGETPVVFH